MTLSEIIGWATVVWVVAGIGLGILLVVYLPAKCVVWMVESLMRAIDPGVWNDD